MGRLKRWQETVRITRLVDEQGRVFCPLRAQDVGVEQCLSCPTRSDLTRSADGGVAEIVCKPSLGSLVASAAS